jgi:hypothetical protein
MAGDLREEREGGEGECEMIVNCQLSIINMPISRLANGIDDQLSMCRFSISQ